MGNSSDRSDNKNSSSTEVTALIEENSTSPQYGSSPCSAPAPKQSPSWASIPHKSQLAVIVFARLAEPLSERSLASYLFYQLRWLNGGDKGDVADIAKQAGYLTAVFAAAQCLTSMFWGRIADHPSMGRKKVLIIGLTGSSIAALGMGFATSLPMAFFFRFLAGALNGNVGVLRTMVSEIVVDKRHQARAFLLLPMCFNVGVIIGPLLSGFLADPVQNLPGIFGPGSFLGGDEGVTWMRRFPFALPNLFFALVLSTAALAIIFGLNETHPQRRHKRDRGRQMGEMIMAFILRRQRPTYERIPGGLDTAEEQLLSNPSQLAGAEAEPGLDKDPKKTRPASLRSIWTSKVSLNMAQRFLQSLHVSSFNSMLFSLLPTPQVDGHDFHLPFRFSGGLGLSSQKMGFANTTIGLIGIPLQLFVYPRLIGSLGVKNSYRYFLPLSIIAYAFVPYLVLLPTDQPALVWTCLSAVLSMQVLSRTFVNPATVMLVNDCAPSPDTLSTIHGLAQSISSAARILGPTIGGSILGWGLGHNFVGLPLWLLAFIAVLNWIVVLRIEDVDMHG